MRERGVEWKKGIYIYFARHNKEKKVPRVTVRLAQTVRRYCFARAGEWTLVIERWEMPLDEGEYYCSTLSARADHSLGSPIKAHNEQARY